MDAELTVRFADTSLDPYVRFFEPRLSPFTNAVAGGTIRVVGELADVDHLVVETHVEQPRSEAVRLPPAQQGHDRPVARSARPQGRPAAALTARAPSCRSTGRSRSTSNEIAVQASGDANLGILQGFYPRPAQPRHGGAQGADQRAARQAGVLRQRDDHRRPHPRAVGAATRSRRSTGGISFDAGGVRLDDVAGAAR